jgi:FMN phosphatase YigB (HAD superfamily)
MIKFLIFDFGGTVDTNGIHWIEKFWSKYREHSIDITKDEFINAYIFAERKMNERIKPEDSFKTTLNNQLSLQFEYLRNNNIGKVIDRNIEDISDECYSGVEKCISQFKNVIRDFEEDFSLSVVSNFYGNLEPVLEEFNIRNCFKIVTDSTLVKVRKPDPEIFRITLRELSALPDETFVIGDSLENDIRPAKGIGCNTIWLIKQTNKKKEDTLYPDYNITSINQLKTILKQKHILQK